MKIHPVILIHAAALMVLGNLSAGQSEGDVVPAEPSLPAAVAIYDSDPSHLWNRIHRAFFSRPDDAGSSIDTVDPPLWPDTSEFLRTGSTYQTAIAVLDEFLTSDGQALIADPLKRAVLQHDLWAVFDWSAHSESAGSAGASSAGNLSELRLRLADAIRQLALSPKAIGFLPDNLANTASADAFRPNYDAEHPRAPFLPTDLLDPQGPWVCVRGVVAGPSAPVHAQYYQGRSPFLVFMKLPDGREATLSYLKDLNEATSKVKVRDSNDLPLFPVGTKVALLRQMAVIDDVGRIRATPLTQTLQMRVYRQVGKDVTDHENAQAAVKFRMKRGELFADGHRGLVPISWSEPLRVSLLHQKDVYDPGHARSGIKTTMQSCIACHSCGGGGTIHSVFSYKQDDWVPGANLVAPNRLRLVATDAATETKKALRWKQRRYEWGLLVGSLEKR
jgi:hypothetical protein